MKTFLWLIVLFMLTSLELAYAQTSNPTQQKTGVQMDEYDILEAPKPPWRPSPLEKVTMQLPSKFQKDSIEGKVGYSVQINKNGKIDSIHIIDIVIRRRSNPTGKPEVCNIFIKRTQPSPDTVITFGRAPHLLLSHQVITEILNWAAKQGKKQIRVKEDVFNQYYRIPFNAISEIDFR